MAKKKQRTTGKHSHKRRAQKKSSVPAERGPSNLSSEQELFVDEVRQQPSQPVECARVPAFGGVPAHTKKDGPRFAGTQMVGTAHPTSALDAATPPLTSIRHKRLSMVQKILVSCIVLIVAMLLYVLLSSLLDTGYSHLAEGRVSSIEHGASSQKLVVSKAEPSQSLPPHSVAGATGPSMMSGGPTEGLSFKTAETFYLQKDFNKAYAAYDQLRQGLLTGQEDPMKDFLALKMALCMKNLVSSRVEAAGNLGQACQIFRMVSQSHYPLIRTVANYHLSLLEMQKEQYLNARRRAYQTMALISALTFDWQWTLSLQRNCQFLIAESVTRHVLSLCDADKDFPVQLWPTPSEADPFINLSETELRCLLNCGSEQLSKAVLSPQIERIDQQGSPARWIVSCNGASIQELLARFAARASLDIRWACDNQERSGIAGQGSATELNPKPYTLNPDFQAESIRNRPVSLYMSAATTQQFVTVAAGCVGLLARLDAGGTVEIFNPPDYASLSEHLALLAQEAISLWQRFLLTYGDDESVYGGANAHFALGLLRACAEGSGQITDAIAEYKLVANRYPRTSLAPYALLASSKLKANLRDYLGAREDLKQLTELYPDTEFSNQACLHLADATMKAGLLSEAAKLYGKVYNLGLSLQSQRVSALGAGRCFYEVKDYQNAAKWLTRYIQLAEDRTSRDFYLACFLLGKTYLAQDLPQQACNAFELALSGKLAVQEYVETVSALVKAQLALGHFVEALKLLENTNSWQLSQKESIEMILLKASVLRSMGLSDEAIAVLGDKAEYVLDPQLKAKISFEQAKCSIDKGDLSLARKNLSEILVLVEPSATHGLAHEVRCELAEVCAKLGADSQAIWICLQLLDSQPDAAIKQRALDLLVTVYRQQKNYDQAALALLGQWVKDDTR